MAGSGAGAAGAECWGWSLSLGLGLGWGWGWGWEVGVWVFPPLGACQNRFHSPTHISPTTVQRDYRARPPAPALALAGTGAGAAPEPTLAVAVVLALALTLYQALMLEAITVSLPVVWPQSVRCFGADAIAATHQTPPP
jgi:hypothetical protein